MIRRPNRLPFVVDFVEAFVAKMYRFLGREQLSSVLNAGA
jgi:hypothetical protein